MYCGLRYESIADMPPKMREQIQGKLMDQIRQKKAVAVAAGPEAPAATGSKYHNEKAEVDGIKFDSRKEARRFCQLKLAMELGVIEDVKSEGTKTRVYINKKKMMADMGYQIREV